MSHTTPESDVERLERVRADGATVVDVREPGEYAAGHVPGPALVPMGQLASPWARSWRPAQTGTSRPD